MIDANDRWVPVCTLETLNAQRIVCGSVSGVAVLIVQNGANIVACERACPHEQADLRLGRVDGGRLHCPHHRASFALDTGDVSAGWSCRPLRRYRTRTDDRQVWVDIAGMNEALAAGPVVTAADD